MFVGKFDKEYFAWLSAQMRFHSESRQELFEQGAEAAWNGAARLYIGQTKVLAELLRDATAVLRTIDPEDTTEVERLESLIDRAEKAYGRS